MTVDRQTLDLNLLRTLITERSGEAPVPASDADLAPLSTAPGWATLDSYFRFCLPAEIYIASGVRVLHLDRILGEVCPGAAPGSHVLSFGYVPFASSIGGNLLCLHSDGVFWVDHTGWYDDRISYRDPATRQWASLSGYSADNVRRAVQWLSRDTQTFLLSLLADQLDSQLDALD
jgi:hypothetical protein